MAAKDALIAYGYVLDGDKYRMPRVGGGWRNTQVWQETSEGWRRFEQAGGADVPEVYQVSVAYRGTSGLDKTRNPEAFIWLWPDGEVERIYAAAVEAESARLAEVLKRKAAEAKA
jgi:hypothetical protein